MKKAKITPLKTNQNDKVLINEQEFSDSERIEYICSLCNCGPLVTITDKTGNTDRFCRNCSAVYSMEDDTVRHKSRLSVPQETEPALSTTPTIGADAVAIHHEPELRGAFKALRDRGIKITHYEERIG
jgi:hypothetical protein